MRRRRNETHLLLICEFCLAGCFQSHSRIKQSEAAGGKTDRNKTLQTDGRRPLSSRSLSPRWRFLSTVTLQLIKNMWHILMGSTSIRTIGLSFLAVCFSIQAATRTNWVTVFSQMNPNFASDSDRIIAWTQLLTGCSLFEEGGGYKK